MALFRPFTSYKFLLYQLTLRDIKARYKQSFVGYAWVLLNPFAQLLVYSFVFSIIFRFPTGGIPYIVFLYAGLLPWTLFQTSITSATQSLVENSILLKKVAFPREVIPYSTVFAKIVDFAFSTILFLALTLYLQVPLSWTALAVVPILLAQLFLTTGIALMFSSFNLFFRDTQYLTNLLLMLWMYMTPIVYPLALVPSKYLLAYKLNPMVGIVEGYRNALFGYSFQWDTLAWSMAVSTFVFFLGFYLFKRSEKNFADVV